MRSALALFGVVLLAGCPSHPSGPTNVLWLAPGENESGYILSTIEPNPF